MFGCRLSYSEGCRHIQIQPALARIPERPNAMNRNLLYLLIAVLAVGVAVVGYLYYEESQSGINIEIGEDGAKIEGN